MKKIITVVAIAMVSIVNAQAFKGKGDVKAQVGLNAQSHGTGINVSADFGIGENMSYGFVASYLLSVVKADGVKPTFGDRADAKVRFNANLGNVFKGIDGGPHKRWSMWFNSTQREEPYPGLTWP